MIEYQSEVALSSDIESIDWAELASLYERASLGKRDPVQLRRAFANSFIVCIARIGGRLVGAARVISDAEYYANIYDVAVLPENQRQGIGRAMMEYLIPSIGEKFIR